MKILLSPCLYCEDENTFDLHLLEETLSFITNFLQGELDEYTNAFYLDERLNPPVISDWSRFNEYSNVIRMLRILKINGDTVNIKRSDIPYKINKDIDITNQREFQYMMDYIFEVGDQDFLLFLGEKNWDIDGSKIEINFSFKNFEIPFVKNPWVETSDNFNQYLKNEINPDKYFPHSQVCCKFEEFIRRKENREHLSSADKIGLYKTYFKVIVERNGYKFDKELTRVKNRKYYTSCDNKATVSCDTDHGGIELFIGHNFNHHVGQYDFSCKNPKKETKKNRGSHKL